MIEKMDLSFIVKAVEDFLKETFKTTERFGIGMCFTMPHENNSECHWVTNLSREDGISLFAETAMKMGFEKEEDLNARRKR